MKRFKTEYPGIFYREADRIGGRGKEKVFYVVYKKGGKVCEEKAGQQYADDMTGAKAARIRGELIEGKRLSRPEKKKARKERLERWTIDKLWVSYKETHPAVKSIDIDEARYRRHLGPSFGDEEPIDLSPLDVKRVSIKLAENKETGDGEKRAGIAQSDHKLWWEKPAVQDSKFFDRDASRK